jgi:hypothetical protein
MWKRKKKAAEGGIESATPGVAIIIDVTWRWRVDQRPTENVAA